MLQQKAHMIKDKVSPRQPSVSYSRVKIYFTVSPHKLSTATVGIVLPRVMIRQVPDQKMSRIDLRLGKTKDTQGYSICMSPHPKIIIIKRKLLLMKWMAQRGEKLTALLSSPLSSP